MTDIDKLAAWVDRKLRELDRLQAAAERNPQTDPRLLDRIKARRIAFADVARAIRDVAVLP